MVECLCAHVRSHPGTRREEGEKTWVGEGAEPQRNGKKQSGRSHLRTLGYKSNEQRSLPALSRDTPILSLPPLVSGSL